MYHLMYQDHVCEAPGGGPDIGHVVSRDFVHWAHLPVSVWNDKPYDEVAIFTGSATVVDGKPFLVYPGLCRKGGDFAGCITGMNYAQAVPADASDPFYTNWTKDAAPGIKIAANPIVNGTSDDPSTAWQTAYGEWRLIGNAGAHGQKRGDVAPIFAAKDFTGAWSLVGDTQFPSGECPSLFPLPPLYPGTSASGPLPTHVHKRGHGSAGCNGDCMTLGTWVDGKPGEVGAWNATPGVPFDEFLIDAGQFYASKDFWDAPNKRRINWGWATIPGGVQSMARVLTYHPDLKQLMHSPAREYEELRYPTPLAQLSSTKVAAYSPLSLGKWADGVGNSSEVLVSFKQPTTPCTIGVTVLGGATTVFIDFVPGATSVQVGIHDGPPATAPPPPVGTKGNGTCGATDFGKDCNVDPTGAWNAQAENITTLEACVAKAKGCKMASFVSFSFVAGNTDCSWYLDCDFAHLCADCSKCGIGCPAYYPYTSEVLRNTGSTAPDLVEAASVVEAAPLLQPALSARQKVRGGVAASVSGSHSASLTLLPDDTEVTLRVFTDRTIVEAYWMDGRVAMTSATRPQMAAAGFDQVSVFSSTVNEVASATAWEMGSIWVNKEEVLATPRVDGHK